MNEKIEVKLQLSPNSFAMLQKLSDWCELDFSETIEEYLLDAWTSESFIRRITMQMLSIETAKEELNL